jgi:general secretion pathway protein G
MFLRRVPRDPFFVGDAETPPEDTWNVRAYGEAPEHTEGDDSSGHSTAGKDVFDVTSKSDRVGINGIPYRQW